MVSRLIEGPPPALISCRAKRRLQVQIGAMTENHVVREFNQSDCDLLHRPSCRSRVIDDGNDPIFQDLLTVDVAIGMTSWKPGRRQHAFDSANRVPIVGPSPREFKLAEKFYPTRHTTLGAVMDAGLAIHAFCFEYGFDQEIDLDRVSGELGREQSSLPVYLVPKLHCPQCLSKNVGTMLVTEGSSVSSEQIEHLKSQHRREG